METLLGLDLPTWWFLVLGAVFSGYALLDGFDLGAGSLHLFLRKEESRRIALNAIGPVWDGNEVWLVIGGGALFAGFPNAYGTIFSAFYVPFMIFLVMLIFRAVSIEFRSKEPMRWWRLTWDISYSVSSIAIGFLLGVVLGNVIRGIAIGADMEFQGHLMDFFNPYAILTGATTVFLFSMHGAIYLAMKTEKRLHTRIILLLRGASRIFVILFVTLTMATLIYIPEMAEKFRQYPGLFVLPAVTMLSTTNIRRLAEKGLYRYAFLFSGLVIFMLLILVAIGLFPVLVPSSLSPEYDMTIYKAAATNKSLSIMLLIAAIGVPIALTYTVFVFWTFRGKVKLDETSY